MLRRVCIIITFVYVLTNDISISLTTCSCVTEHANEPWLALSQSIHLPCVIVTSHLYNYTKLFTRATSELYYIHAMFVGLDRTFTSLCLCLYNHTALRDLFNLRYMKLVSIKGAVSCRLVCGTPMARTSGWLQQTNTSITYATSVYE